MSSETRYRTEEILLEHTSLTKKIIAQPLRCNECGHQFMHVSMVNKWGKITCPKCGTGDKGYTGFH